MRKKMWLIFMMGIATQLSAQMHTEKIVKEFSFEKKSSANALIIANVNGNIKVQTYDGDKIQVEVSKRINAKTTERLDKGMAEIKLGVVDLADTIILYIDGPCTQFEKNTKHSRHHSNVSEKWGYVWMENDHDCRESYSITMDFMVKVPASLNLLVSTINDGDILVENVTGVVTAKNINGSIRLNNLMREADASTINGNVDVEYTQNPKSNCRFYSLNGDINALFQKGLAASMSFESFNGCFFTNIDRLEQLPVVVEKRNSEEGTKYKINNNRFKIGAGGALLDFETFNGNVFLKEK